VDRLDDGKLGRVMTRHIKYLVSEVWESVSVALREDNKKVILVKSGIRREFDLNDQDEVVGMVKFRCEGIEETNFLSESEFRRTEVKKKEPEKEEKAKMMSGKKHHNVDKEEGGSSPVKKSASSTSYGKARPPPSAHSGGGGYHSKKGSADGGAAKSTAKNAVPWLCLFNLKFQYLGAKQDCAKKGNCGRAHFEKTKKDNPNYYWTLTTMTEAVNRASDSVLEANDKKKLIVKLKKEFDP
jgi:hypothetical protein